MEDVVGLWKRMFSFIIDLMIINIIIIYPFRGMFIKYFTGLTISQAWNSNSFVLPNDAYWAILIISILALLYFTFFDYYLGQTPGKMLYKIRVICTKDKDGQVEMWRAMIRNSFILPIFPFYILWLVEPIYLAFYKERLLEKLTSTKTVYEKETNNIKGYASEYKLEKV